jgi:hypothetical protein
VYNEIEFRISKVKEPEKSGTCCRSFVVGKKPISEF